MVAETACATTMVQRAPRVHSDVLHGTAAVEVPCPVEGDRWFVGMLVFGAWCSTVFICVSACVGVFYRRCAYQTRRRQLVSRSRRARVRCNSIDRRCPSKSYAVSEKEPDLGPFSSGVLPTVALWRGSTSGAAAAACAAFRSRGVHRLTAQQLVSSACLPPSPLRSAAIQPPGPSGRRRDWRRA
jgi:hypothetical protein